MGNIVVREGNICRVLPNEVRKHFAFVCRDTKCEKEYDDIDTFPVFVMINKETNIPVNYPGYERFLINVIRSQGMKGTTLAKRGKAVCDFLNYVLHETDINAIHECTLNDIKNYLVSIKTDKDGNPSNPDTWRRKKHIVIEFLYNYYNAYSGTVEFKYNGEILQQKKVIKDHQHKRKIIIVEDSGFNVSAPHGRVHKKNRILPYEYLYLMLYEAQKYDPDIALGIALQAFAGLREGEVVNMTCGAYKEVYRQFGRLSSIELDLSNDAPFFLNWNKKVSPGAIKVYRTQKVYDDFIDKVKIMHDAHIERMESKGYCVGKREPLFRNKQGKPMTVQTYSGRVKMLFYNHFLPSLKADCDRCDSWVDNIAYIETYEHEYPGAHMFRHWFTMYLVTHARLESGEIMKWRGDSSQESMNAYLHENSVLIENYISCTYRFQEQIVERIRY